MIGDKDIAITLKVYASAYKIVRDKKLRKKRGRFLDNWHKSGTANNPMFDKPQKTGVPK